MAGRTILFISKGSESPSTRYRALNYFDRLRGADWNPVHIAAPRGVFDRMRVLKAVRSADVVVNLRKTWAAPFRRVLRRAAKRLVFDFDDAVFVDDDGSESPTRMRRFAAMVGSCDQVWAGNSYLAETAAKYNEHVTVLPTSIDPDRYIVDAEKPTGAIDVVWIGGSATRKYLEAVMPALEAFGASVDMRLKIIADFDLRSTLRTLPIRWSPEIETVELASSHIGIAPMNDDAWTRGKCGLKVLQYLAARLPVVVTDTGVHREMIQDGQTGFLVRDDQQWMDALTRLARDSDLRRSLGDQGRTCVVGKYAIESTAKKMIDLLDR